MSSRDVSAQNLPRGWAPATVGDIAHYINGLAFKPSDWEAKGRPIIRIQNLTGQSAHLNLTTRHVDPKYIVQPGTILVSWSATLDVFVWRGPEAVLNQHIFKVVLVATMSDHSFVRWALKNAIDEMWRGEHTHGTTMRHINRGPFLAHRLNVPPANEQTRIAEAIDSYLTRLDDTVANLKRAQTKLKTYRASVLKAAVEGRLVPTEASLARVEKRDYEPAEVLVARIVKERRRRWEQAEFAKLKAAGKTPRNDKWKAKYHEPVTADTTGLPKLPEGWCWVSLDQLLYLLRNGQSMAPREETGVRTLRISAVRPLAVDFQDVRYLPGNPTDYQDDLVEVGDLLFTRYNGTPSLVGVCGRVRVLTEPTVHPDKLIKVRLCSDLHTPYVELAANVGESREFIERRIRTTAGQAGISGSDLKQIPVPVPPLSEQVRIGDEVERLVSLADETKGAVAIDEQRCARLRQSILKWAFEGKLVDQDPSDEPADKLLARIGAERGVVISTEKIRGRTPEKPT